MTSLCALWLPILLSTVFIFIVSSVIHTVLPWHKNDFGGIPDEDNVISALRPFNIPAGDFMLPKPTCSADLKKPEFLDKLNKGPVIVMTVLPAGPFRIGKSLLLWFIYCGIVGIFSAYLASRSLGAGAPPLHVIQIAATAAFMGYAFALWQMSIWYNRNWRTTIKSTIDGLIYALVTGATLAWLWPAAT